MDTGVARPCFDPLEPRSHGQAQRAIVVTLDVDGALRVPNRRDERIAGLDR
jgi:hypothetical protein